MADRPRDDEWWLASDGKWYPPGLESAGDTDQRQPQDDSAISVPFTRALTVSLAIAAALLAGSAYSGLRYASALQKFSGQLSESETASLESVELVWVGWTGLALLLLIVTGVLVIGWTRHASRALDCRGPIGRRWRGAWTIGAWFIPFGNLVLPKLVFNEIERIAQVPFRDVPVGEEWRTFQRSQLGDLWWLLWIGGVIPSQAVQIVLGDPAADAGRLAILVTISSFSYALFAGAGIALAFLVRGIEKSSRESSSGPSSA